MGVNVRAAQIINPQTKVRTQRYFTEWKEHQKADGVSSAQFWDAYQESLKEVCPNQ